MKKKLLLTLLCVTLLASLAFAVVPAYAAEESKIAWSSCSGGVYDGVTYNNPGQDFYLGTDTEGNLFYETVGDGTATAFSALPQTEYYVDGFKIDFKIAPIGNANFAEGQTYYVGLGTTENGILNALKLVWTDGGFNLYAIAAGHNPDNGGNALANAEGTIKIAAGETISYQLKADAAQENLDVYVNGYKTFTSANYPCFASSAAHVYYNRDGAYKGKIFVYDGPHCGLANVPNRITFTNIQNGEYTRVETVTSAAATVVDNAYWSYENVLYAPNNEFFVGRDGKNNFFYQTHSSAYLSYHASSNALYYANGFKTTFSFDLFEGQSYTEGYKYIIGLSNVAMGMPMVSVAFTYSEGKGFKATYHTAGLNTEGDLNVNGEIMYVQSGEKITLEFKETTGGLGIYLNGVLGHTTGRYPAHENPAYTLPQNGLKQYVGYFTMDVNYWLGNGSNIGNRVTYYELPEKITGKGVAPDVSTLNGTLDPSLVYFTNHYTWGGIGGNLETNNFGTINYSNPTHDFWLTETDNGELVYESEGTGTFNAYSDLKFKVDGFKMSFMVQNKGDLTVGSKMFIGLSNVKQGMTMAAIELKWTGKYFEMRYSSAGALNYSGNELSTYGNIGHLWLGQKITFEYKANEEGGMDVIVNGEKAFTTPYYPSFNGLADYTFPQENGEYVGYFTVHNGTIDSPAVVASRITFFDLLSTETEGGGEDDTDDPVVPEDPKETAPEGLDTTIDENVTAITCKTSTTTLDTEKYGEITINNNVASEFIVGEDANKNIFFQSIGNMGYGALTTAKAYVDGFKMSFMVQQVGEGVLPNGYAIQIGLSNIIQGMTMAAIELKWTGKYFEMKYSAAGIYNYSGNELSTYSDQITHLWLGQTMTFEYKANEDGGLDIYVNNIYTFTTPYYPSFNGLADYTFPKDENGRYYGYFSIHNGTFPSSNSAEHRITFSELTLEYSNSDADYEYEVITELAESAEEITYVHGAACTFERVNYTSVLGENYLIGRDVNDDYYIQSYNNKPFIALTDKKVYADGSKFSFMVQKIGEKDIADGSYFFIGMSESKNGAPMVSIYLVWNAKKQVFEMYYRAAGLSNGDGSRFSTYHSDIHNLHLGEMATVQFKQATDGRLEVWMNDIYLFTTGTYPSFPGAAQYTLPNDEYGYYGYFAVYYCAGLPQVANECDVRITFFDIVANGFASGTENVYDADNAETYAEGTTIGSIANDFVYRTLTSGVGKGNVMYASGKDGAFSFKYTDTVVLNAVSFALNAVAYTKGETVYSFTFIDSTNENNKVKVSIEKADANKANVYVNGENVGEIKFDWTNVNATSIVNIGLFINNDNAILQVDTASYILSEEVFELLCGFGKNNDGKVVGYLEVANEKGSAAIVLSDVVTDGTAVQKKIAKTINTTIADVILAYGTEFVNEYTTVEVSFYDGSVENMTVTWDESAINIYFAAPYNVTGTFDNITSNYFFSEEIKAMLKFVVNVQYQEGFYKYGTSEYDNQSGSIWFTCGGGANEFLYKNNGDGTYTIVSDGYKGGQFMPATTQYRDIDGYKLNYTQELYSNGGMLLFMMLPQPKHPVEFGTPIIGLVANMKATGSVNFNFFAGGQTEAYAKDSEGNLIREFTSGALDGVSIRAAIVETEEIRYVKFYVTVNGVEYELVNSDGLDYTDYSTNLDKFTNDQAYICLWNEVGYSSYTFSEEYTKYVVGYTKPQDAIVEFGSEHGLPTEIELTLNDGSKVMGNVTWSGDYNKEVSATYKVTGTISYEGIGNGETIFDGINGTMEVNVTVKAEVKEITYIQKPEDITIEFGSEYTLQDIFTVSVYSSYYDTTTEEEIHVIWTGDVNVLVAGTYTLTAQPIGNYIFAEGVVDNLSVSVVVKEASTNSGNDSVSENVGESACFGGFGSISAISFAVLGMAIVALKKRSK